MMAIGSDELLETVKDGDRIINNKTGDVAKVEFHHSDQGNASLLTVVQGDSSFLVGINGQLIKPWRRVND